MSAPTLFCTLDAARCVVLDASTSTLRIKHPDAAHPRWFHFSRQGHLVWRQTNAGGNTHVYIIRRDDPDFTRLVAHLRRAPCGCAVDTRDYPEYTHCPVCGGKWRNPTAAELEEDARWGFVRA